jgi:hypothetical protein
VIVSLAVVAVWLVLGIITAIKCPDDKIPELARWLFGWLRWRK